MAEVTETVPVSEQVQDGKIIWCGKRNKSQKKIDDEANRFFLTVVRGKWNKLCDGTSKKNVIWEDIGGEMNTNGYKTSAGNKPGVICSQKWNNMLKMYKNFTLLVEKTGSGADVLDQKPQFYDEIQEILGTAQNVHPQYVGDSTLHTQNPTSMDIESNRKKLSNLENQKLSHPTSHLSDNESVNKIHFSDDECDEEDYDKNHLDQRSKKRKRNRKGSNVEKMIDMLTDMEKKREAERQEMRLEKQKRHEENIDQTKNLIEILRMAVTQPNMRSNKENKDSSGNIKNSKKSKTNLKKRNDKTKHLPQKDLGDDSSVTDVEEETDSDD